MPSCYYYYFDKAAFCSLVNVLMGVELFNHCSIKQDMKLETVRSSDYLEMMDNHNRSRILLRFLVGMKIDCETFPRNTEHCRALAGSHESFRLNLLFLVHLQTPQLLTTLVTYLQLLM